MGIRRSLKWLVGAVAVVMILVGATFASHHMYMMWSGAEHSGHAVAAAASTGQTGGTGSHDPSAGHSSSMHRVHMKQQLSGLKAFSPEEIDAYLEGQGMGLAKVAEMHHFPGPKHVLEHATALDLSPDQREQTQRLKDRTISEAAQLGEKIMQKEKALDALYATGQVEPSRLASMVSEIAQLQGKLRLIHLNAHSEMKQLLSAGQIEKYDQLRSHH